MHVHGRCSRCVVEGRMTGCLLSSLKFGTCCSQRHHVKGVTFHRQKQKVNVHTLPNPSTSLLINKNEPSCGQVLVAKLFIYEHHRILIKMAELYLLL